MNNSSCVKICQICLKREIDTDLGLVCSLTKAPASFEGSCGDYTKDEEAVINLEFDSDVFEVDEADDSDSGTIGFGFQKQINTGIALIVVAVIWFAIGLFGLSTVYFYPVIMVLVGLYLLLNGIKNKMDVNKKTQADSTILDSEI